MATAHLYIRVSTDEQADKGFSQRDQDERLRNYCKQHDLTVGNVIYEDHSAKTFERPEWIKLVSEIKRTRGKTCDYVLFTKWDRFTRKAMDGYNMINFLMGFDIMPIAIEQPLDLTIPEQKLMLAVYLSMPEVENDRRGLNVKYGMRRAKKEGRWMGMALPGYINRVREDGTKMITFQEPDASLMKWSFGAIAKNIYPTEHVWKLARRQGLKCSRVSFWRAIKNPGYCGLIKIPKLGNEEEQLVKGIHEPLISETLFYDVQDVLEGRQRNQYIKVAAPEELPLRGFLICPSCGNVLTGSGSKGRSKYYFYYHCARPCKVRWKCEDINERFLNVLQQFIPRKGRTEAFRTIVKDTYEDGNSIFSDERKKYIGQVSEQNNRMTKARELLLADAITTNEYKELKSDAEEAIKKLEAKVADLNTKLEMDFNILSILDTALTNLKNLVNLYQKADVEGRQYIIGSMFKEKFVFDGEIYRTAKLNLVFRLIYQINNPLWAKKNGVGSRKRTNSNQVHL